jgi:hypothetical protein
MKRMKWRIEASINSSMWHLAEMSASSRTTCVTSQGRAPAVYEPAGPHLTTTRVRDSGIEMLSNVVSGFEFANREKLGLVKPVGG